MRYKESVSIINTSPVWTKGELKRLGEAMVSDQRTPEVAARYDEVMLWHNDLAAEIATILFSTEWRACSPGLFDITARPKTIDTLVQKLRRERSMKLDEVQDLAGVRIDAEITLDVQTRLAEEIAAHFGEKSRVRDLRDKPHSGYRAVHVWLRLPAGRVEIQIRTVAQSEWANTYERLGDRFGRGIRYDQMPDDEEARAMVELMHDLSDHLARGEQAKLKAARLLERLEHLRAATSGFPARAVFLSPISRLKLFMRHIQARWLARNIAKIALERDDLQVDYLNMLKKIQSKLDEDGS
jgi:ppGpp synthetase/RelA/SpoT-type nucleotidyltranferase